MSGQACVSLLLISPSKIFPLEHLDLSSVQEIFLVLIAYIYLSVLFFPLSFHFYRWLLNLLTFSSMALNLFIFNIFYVFVFCMSWEVSLTLLLTLIWPSVLSILLFDSYVQVCMCACFALQLYFLRTLLLFSDCTFFPSSLYLIHGFNSLLSLSEDALKCLHFLQLSSSVR